MNYFKKQVILPTNTFDYQDLIINNPENQSVWKRLGFHLLTILFWAIWLYLWTPLPGLIKNFFLSDFSAISFQPGIYVVVSFTLFFSLMILQVGWVAYNKKRFTDRRRPSKKNSLSNHELGHFFEIDNNKLEYWQQCKCLVMLHHDAGGIEAIKVNNFFSFAPSLPKGKKVSQGFQRYYIVLVPKRANALLFVEEGTGFEGIIKILCTVFKIKFVSSEQTKYNLSLTVEIPMGFKIKALVKQLKSGSSSIINRKTSNHQDKSESFWYSKSLVSKDRLPEQKIHNLVIESVQTTQQYYIILVPNQSNHLLFTKEGIDFKRVFKRLCTIFKIKLVSSEQTKFNLSLTIEIPMDFKIKALVRQLKSESSSIINRKKSNHPEKNESFWYSESLVSKDRLSEQKTHNLVMKSMFSDGQKSQQPVKDSNVPSHMFMTSFGTSKHKNRFLTRRIIRSQLGLRSHRLYTKPRSVKTTTNGTTTLQ